LDEHELAWAAGFFDGDGWAALSRQRGRRTGQPQARINQSGLDGVPEVLVRFRDAVGVGRIGGPKIEDRREPLYWWVASSRGDVARTGELIGGWLSGQKRVQFTAATGLRFHAAPMNSFAWVAGLFDAEGSTSLSDHRSHAGYKVIEAAITQSGVTIPEELVRVHALLERGNVNGPYVQEGANELIYRWRASRADDVRMLLHLLDPWLGQVKRAQAPQHCASSTASHRFSVGGPNGEVTRRTVCTATSTPRRACVRTRAAPRRAVSAVHHSNVLFVLATKLARDDWP